VGGLATARGFGAVPAGRLGFFDGVGEADALRLGAAPIAATPLGLGSALASSTGSTVVPSVGSPVTDTGAAWPDGRAPRSAHPAVVPASSSPASATAPT